MKDVSLVIGVIAASVLVAAVVARVIGCRIARKNRMGAIVLSGLMPSIALVLVEIALFASDADFGGDGPAMALAGSLLYAVLCLPFTLPIAAVVIRRSSPR